MSVDPDRLTLGSRRLHANSNRLLFSVDQLAMLGVKPSAIEKIRQLEICQDRVDEEEIRISVTSTSTQQPAVIETPTSNNNSKDLERLVANDNNPEEEPKTEKDYLAQEQYIVRLSVKRQNRFLRFYFGLLTAILCFTLVVSFQLIELHKIDSWVMQYPWIAFVVGAVAILVLILYTLPCFRRSSYALQIFTFACMGISWTAVITLIGTFINSGAMFRVVTVVTLVVFIMFLTSLSDSSPFSPVLGYVIIIISTIVAMILLVWLPNKDFFGITPNQNWLYPPGDVTDFVITIGLSAYCSFCFVHSVRDIMKTSTENDYIDAAISAYVNIVKFFVALFVNGIFSAVQKLRSNTGNQ